MTCYCDGSCPSNTQNGTCEVRSGGQCFSAVEEVVDDINGQIEPEYSFGCLSPDQAGGLLQVSLIAFCQCLIKRYLFFLVQCWQVSPNSWKKYNLLLERRFMQQRAPAWFHTPNNIRTTYFKYAERILKLAIYSSLWFYAYLFGRIFVHCNSRFSLLQETWKW